MTLYLEEIPIPAPRSLNPAPCHIFSPLMWEREQLPAILEPRIEAYWQRQVAQANHLAHLDHIKRKWQADPELAIQADLRRQPKFIQQPLQQRLDYLRREGGEARAKTFLLEVIKPVLHRLETVRKKQRTEDYQRVTYYPALRVLLDLPTLMQKEVKNVAARVAGHMELFFCACAEVLPDDNTDPDKILRLYQRVAAEAKRFSITPPHWHSLREHIQHRGKMPYHLIPGALARLCCADWWARKLWRLRCEWREEQYRAICLVHKQASAYVSYDALTRKREQDRRAREFIRSHELVNEDGVTLDMEKVVNASTSNPHLRHLEMMTTARGLENLAEQRGDYAMFYTLTCPSRYHATLSCGKPNPKWATHTVRESSDYLVALFAGVRKKMNKMGLRWYGVRVAEPHHDGTVHWHLLCFMARKDRVAITAVLREFAIRSDREELGKNIKPRFDVKPVLKSKGSPTSYLAKYISKNMDGTVLKKVVDKATDEPLLSTETGKPLNESVENAVAWASLHRVRQFQFFGIPSRQTYRELRLLAGQLQRKAKSKKSTQLLDDKPMDDVLAAADAGCMATYIIKQGGVLIPRKDHTVRTAYIKSETLNAYGEQGVKIYGVWSPRLGMASRICTHVDTWKKVRKAKSDKQPVHPVNQAESDLGLGVALQDRVTVPWTRTRTRGNNCPLARQIINSKKRGKGAVPMRI